MSVLHPLWLAPPGPETHEWWRREPPGLLLLRRPFFFFFLPFFEFSRQGPFFWGGAEVLVFFLAFPDETCGTCGSKGGEEGREVRG